MTEFIPSTETLEKLKFIEMLQKKTEENGFTLWHCGSWAVTAMVGKFFKDLKDIDIVVETEKHKEALAKIVESMGFKLVSRHPWGPDEYSNGTFDIEFGSTEDNRNLYYKAILDKINVGYINEISIYIADPKKILQSRHNMIKAGYKKLDDTQKFIIDTITTFINRK